MVHKVSFTKKFAKCSVVNVNKDCSVEIKKKTLEKTHEFEIFRSPIFYISTIVNVEPEISHSF